MCNNKNMRNIPEDNLAYPVLLKFDTGSSGSSFFLRTDKNLYLITAKHVLFDSKNKLRGKRITLLAQTKEILNKTVTKHLIDLSKVKVFNHLDDDIAAIEIASIQAIPEQKGRFVTNYHNGVKITEQGSTGIIAVNAKNSVKLLSDVLISNDVFLYGYPTSLGLQSAPQFNYDQPLLRKGIIANIYRDKGTIILDCPVYYGNSGGPVIEVERQGLNLEYKVIGVVSEFIPFVEQWENKRNKLVKTEVSNSGYSVVVAMDKVFKLIDYKKE